MDFLNFIWTDDIVEHLAEHGVSQEDFEYVVCNPVSKGLSRSTGVTRVFGTYATRSRQ